MLPYFCGWKPEFSEATFIGLATKEAKRDEQYPKEAKTSENKQTSLYPVFVVLGSLFYILFAALFCLSLIKCWFY